METRHTDELEKKKNGVYTFDMWLEKTSSNYSPPGENYDNYQNIGEISRDFTWLEDVVM